MALPEVDAELVFRSVDTGVATDVRQLSVAEFRALELVGAIESPDGASFSLTSCITTWSNRWEVSGEWAPALNAQAGPTDWILSLALVHGDVVGLDVGAAVTLEGPGKFTLPMVFDPNAPSWRRAGASHGADESGTQLPVEHRRPGG